MKDLLPDVSEKALNLIGNLIVFNPKRRLTAVKALEDPYVAQYIHFSIAKPNLIHHDQGCNSIYSFHKQSNEPERGSSVVPLLRDDVQLSVDEYRNKLYSMMDEKHRKHKNMWV